MVIGQVTSIVCPVGKHLTFNAHTQHLRACVRHVSSQLLTNILAFFSLKKEGESCSLSLQVYPIIISREIYQSRKNNELTVVSNII